MFGGGLLSLYIYIHTYIYIYIYIYICICIYMYLLTTLLEAPHQLRKRKGNGAKSVISSQHFGAKLTTNTTHTHTHTHTHTQHTHNVQMSMKCVNTWMKLCARNIECTRSLKVSKGKESRQHVSIKNIRHSVVRVQLCVMVCCVYCVR